MLAPAALAEELMFRGLPIVALDRTIGRGAAVGITALAFALTHAGNPSITTLSIGNICIAGILLGVIFFWLFGQQLEALFGRGKFLAWVLMCTIIPALILTALGPLDSSIDFFAQLGLSTLFLGGIWVYAATYPGVRWFDVIPLWGIAAVFTVLNLLQFTGVDATGQVIFLLVSVAVALVAGRSLGLATGWPIPHIPLDGSSHRTHKPKKAKAPKKPRSSGSSSSTPKGPTVIDGPWRAGPPPMPPATAPPSLADQEELDSLLDKIGATGMDSLTSGEKKRLNDLSKRLRNR